MEIIINGIKIEFGFTVFLQILDKMNRTIWECEYYKHDCASFRNMAECMSLSISNLKYLVCRVHTGAGVAWFEAMPIIVV